MEQNKVIIPLAIIVAGALVAGAIYFSSDKNPTQAPVASTEQKIDINPITSADHILGDPQAKVVLVEYSDTECPFCKDFHVTMNKLVADFGSNGKMAWVYRHFPIASLHPKAQKESEALECAAEMGGNNTFWQYANKLYEITPSNNKLDPKELTNIAIGLGLDKTTFDSCVQSGKFSTRVENDYKNAIAIGARGTPSSVLISQTKINKGTEDFVTELKRQLNISDPNAIRISKDKKMIFMGGALPYELVKQLISLMAS